jgi:hypothetical protein
VSHPAAAVMISAVCADFGMDRIKARQWSPRPHDDGDLLPGWMAVRVAKAAQPAERGDDDGANKRLVRSLGGGTDRNPMANQP